MFHLEVCFSVTDGNISSRPITIEVGQVMRRNLTIRMPHQILDADGHVADGEGARDDQRDEERPPADPLEDADPGLHCSRQEVVGRAAHLAQAPFQRRDGDLRLAAQASLCRCERDPYIGKNNDLGK